MNKLPEKPPEKSFFYWDDEIIQYLGEIRSDADFKKAVTEYNNRYLYWDELKYRIKEPEKRKAAWALMKSLREMRYENVPFPYMNLRYSLTPEISRNLHMFDQYLSGNIRIHNRKIKLEESYIISSLMEEAIASSILEGAATTHKAAKEMLRKGRKPKNKSEYMVMNNYMAMQEIREHKDEPLTPELILKIHRAVTQNTLDEESVGQFRRNDDIVISNPVTGAVHHTPPGHTEISGLIEELCRFANKNEENSGLFIHPVIKGIILHFLIGYIHPFEDGNGRTARSIFYWYVLSRGYWLFEYMPISRIILRSKKNYALAYLHTEYDEMDLTYFILYNIRCIEGARKDLLSYIEDKQSEEKTKYAIIKKIRDINQRQAGILGEMMKNSENYFTIREIMQTYAVVYQTARSDLLHLADLGYIKKEKRGREFMFIFNEGCELNLK